MSTVTKCRQLQSVDYQNSKFQLLQNVDYQKVDCYKTLIIKRSTATKRRLLQNIDSYKMSDYDGLGRVTIRACRQETPGRGVQLLCTN